jgi:hypothetical protein
MLFATRHNPHTGVNAILRPLAYLSIEQARAAEEGQ